MNDINDFAKYVQDTYNKKYADYYEGIKGIICLYKPELSQYVDAPNEWFFTLVSDEDLLNALNKHFIEIRKHISESYADSVAYYIIQSPEPKHKDIVNKIYETNGWDLDLTKLVNNITWQSQKKEGEK